MTAKTGQMKCLSFQQPFATFIALGLKTIEIRSRNIKTPIKDLVVCASKTATFYYPISGLVYGYAVGMVDVVDCRPFRKEDCQGAMTSMMPSEKDNAWVLENPRLIKPFPVKATASFFYVDHDVEVIPTDFDSYLANYAKIAVVEDPELASDNVVTMFNEPPKLWDIFEL